MKIRVLVRPKAGILDPQGKAIEGALKPIDRLTSNAAGARIAPPRRGW